MCRAPLTARSPMRLSRCRTVCPDDASSGATLARRAKAASECRAGRDRRDPPVDVPPAQLRVGRRRGHRGVLRRDRPPGPDGPGAGTDRRQRVLALVKAFLKASIVSEDKALRDTATGTPQGGILSPLLANIALSMLNEHFTAAWAAMATPAPGTAAAPRAKECIDSSAMRMTSSSWFTALRRTPKRCGTRPQPSSPRWACPSRRQKPRSSRSTRASTSGLPHPATAQARQREADHLHLSDQGRALLGQVQGADGHPAGTEQAARRPVAPARAGPAGLGQLLPARRLQGHLRLPAPLHLASGAVVDATQTPPCQLQGAPSPLPARVVADGRERGAVRHRQGGGHLLPTPAEHPTPWSAASAA